VTLYCLLFGKLPFCGASETELMERISRDELVIPDTFPPLCEPSVPAATTVGGSLSDNPMVKDPRLFIQRNAEDIHRIFIQNGPNPIPVPSEVKDLLGALLHKDPASRLSLRAFKRSKLVQSCLSSWQRAAEEYLTMVHSRSTAPQLCSATELLPSTSDPTVEAGLTARADASPRRDDAGGQSTPRDENLENNLLKNSSDTNQQIKNDITQEDMQRAISFCNVVYLPTTSRRRGNSPSSDLRSAGGYPEQVGPEKEEGRESGGMVQKLREKTNAARPRSDMDAGAKGHTVSDS
jgi:serine/threonine protein kinase